MSLGLMMVDFFLSCCSYCSQYMIGFNDDGDAEAIVYGIIFFFSFIF
jgi:hypothetical protein